MPRLRLSLETLARFDFGKADTAFRQCLALAVKDIQDRPGDKHARKVQLTATLVPVLQQDGDVVEAAIDFQIATKIPAYQTAARPLAVTRQGDLIFSEDAPDNPHQTTLSDLEEAEDEED